jgi:DNA-binding NtrC family response regulator
MSQAMKIAIVDDERDMRQSISQWLALSGYDTEAFASAEEALKAIGPDYPGIVISDIKMPGMDGISLSEEADERRQRAAGHHDHRPWRRADGGRGDADRRLRFPRKAVQPGPKMTELAKKATTRRRVSLDNRALRRELSDGSTLMKKLIGASPVMDRLREDILDLGQADGHVLIDGETGTGKTLVAHALHAVGAKAGRPSCWSPAAPSTRTALVQRLFGPAEEGGSPPAVEEARGGTLVLEDVEALPEALQARLLTWINEQGSPPETRVIAISNLQEQGKTCEDRLRPDLFYRLAAMKITLPPLRNRGEDILMLFSHYGDQFAEEYGCAAPKVNAQEAAQLLEAPWPGNIRQLINVAERAVLQSRRGSGHDRLAPDDRRRGQPAGDDHRGQAAEGICRGVRADADRQHDAPAQGLDQRGDGRALPAAPDAEREDGEIRSGPLGLYRW